ncbi:MAG TPA: serine hydrolase domain-containing protein [Thermoanaerobaculia bacterium]|nr:serine hydrolase domain-containing protein [Thermoanaerobaculia bacterium]
MRHWTIALSVVLISLGAVAQEPAPQRRVVRIVEGDGPDERTRDWPKPAWDPSMTDAQKAAALGAMIDALAARDLFSGVVLVRRGETEIVARAWGLAERGHGVANTLETRFNIGSINKLFTSIAIRKAAADGKLALSDTIAKHLGAGAVTSGDTITIEQLLQHRSGLGDIFTEEFRATHPSRLRTTEDYMRIVADDPLLFEPGSSQRYSNAGFIVLGAILEKIYGRPYPEIIRDVVFAPAGMKSTGLWGPDEIVPNRATGYTRDGGEMRSNVYALPGRGSAAGGAFATARDLAALAGALARSAYPGMRAGIGVAGGTAGANAILEAQPDGSAIVVLANLDPPAAEYVGRAAREIFFGTN